jgi:2,4-dichlorophenol 6-monooxygenase
MTASRILDGDYHDPHSAWQRQRQIASDGAILVRPDRFIAWRSPAADGEPRAALAAALSQILGRGPVCSGRVGRFPGRAGAAQR